MKLSNTALGLAAGGFMTTCLTAQLTLTPISSIGQPNAAESYDKSAAEIVSHDPASQRLFVVNADTEAIDVYGIADPLNPAFLFAIDVSSFGAPNSVDVNPDKKRDEIAVAVQAPNKQDPGFVLFYESTGNCDFISSAQAGALPDMVTYDNKGRLALVANEGEPNDDYSVDPEGSVTIVDVKKSATNPVVTQVSFAGLAEADVEGVRITGPEGTTIAQDLEPEYIAISPNNRKAYVACQENNAIIVIDIKSASIDSVFGLGSKDHSMVGNELDASNRDVPGSSKDGIINIRNWPVHGLYMPDAIATFRARGGSYIITTNEGDSREYDTYVDEDRIGDADLDPAAFPNASFLQDDDNLGRLKFVTTEGDTDGDGDYDKLYSFGGRSFSIFKEDGTLVFDSGSEFETITSILLPDDFNSNNDEDDTFDNRSDDKGPEPEAVAVAKIKGKTYAFIGLERIGGVMTYDVSNPYAPAFVSYVNNRDFSQDFAEENEDEELEIIDEAAFIAAGDLGPECVIYIDAKDSPNGEDLVVVSNEVSGTVTIYSVD